LAATSIKDKIVQRNGSGKSQKQKAGNWSKEAMLRRRKNIFDVEPGKFI
jgi:hypothetical protein